MKLLFIGFGTVGQGLAELLIEKEDLLHEGYGLKFQVVGISDMLKGSAYDPEGLGLSEALRLASAGEPLSELGGVAFEGDALAMIQQADADVMIEVTYTDLKTGEPGRRHIRTALERGMDVATTNKGPIALHYNELHHIARQHGRRLLFEGTVMSGTPLLNLIRENLAGSGIRELKGILNGTTNFILTRMEEGLAYRAALKEAQRLGYAEAIPDADVMGWDALAKVTILANVAFGESLEPSSIPCEGVTNITPEDIANAKARGRRFKLIGRVWREGDQVKASVGPEEVELTHPLAGVMGATNALTISTETLGDVTIVGPGAGRRPTGYSLLIDLIRIGGRA